ncbi:hypothetical protein DQ403_22335 [Stutzerimonas zhaodongensis]|jgi:hypothetical protein|uniref:Uncharacterized protein n=1 Tax=Stutzerimonas zhaodongensis TaxID=1176257 RepID=A0A365PPC2_9GAMM|nr:hypothetical protein [Stutzerimonas zhaodongensis]RBA51291.1 hypothetical protein DQ403_22335 [Stutzerimonas zhaodongensis]
MFLTLDHAEVPVGSLLRGAHTWRYVEYLASLPYFHVSAVDQDDEGIRPTTLLIYTVQDLVDLAAAKANGWKIEQVQLVSPGRMNGTGEWRMEELRAVEGTQVARGTSYAYVLKSGATYFDHESSKSLPPQRWRLTFSADAGN